MNLSIAISDEIEVAVIAFDENKTILSFKFISILVTGTCYIIIKLIIIKKWRRTTETLADFYRVVLPLNYLNIFL